MSIQAGPSPPSSAPTLGPDLVQLRTALCAELVAVDLVAALDAPTPSNALPVETRVPQLCQGMRRMKEKDDLDKVWSANRLTPNTMGSQATQDTPEVASTRQDCRRKIDQMHSGVTASSTMVGRRQSSPCLWCPPPPNPSSGRSGREWRSWQGTRTSS